MQSPLFAQARLLALDFVGWQHQLLFAYPPGNNMEARDNARCTLRQLADVREDLEALPVSDETLWRQLARTLRDLMAECERLTAWVDERTAVLRPLHVAAHNPGAPLDGQAQQAAYEAWNAVHIPASNEWEQVWKANIHRIAEQLADLEQRLDRLPDAPPPPPESSAEAVALTASQPQAPSATGQRGTVNQRILDQLQRDPLSADWSQRKWAKHLGCSPSTVADAAAWQTVKTARAVARTDRLDRRKRRQD
jgi:hypothetical protein